MNNTMTTLGSLLLVSILSVSAKADQQTSETRHEKTWRGTLTEVNAQNRTIRCERWMVTETFRLGDHCVVSAIDKTDATLSDLHPGEKVEIQYQKGEGVRVAERIAERALSYVGRVRDMDRRDRIVTIENKAFHKTFSVAGDCEVIRADGNRGTIEDVRPGFKVIVTYETPGGAPVAYRLREESVTLVGKLVAIDLPDRTLKVTEGSSEKTFTAGKECKIVVNGKTNTRLSDLVLGQDYRLTFENIDGVNVVASITPASEPNSNETASTK